MRKKLLFSLVVFLLFSAVLPARSADNNDDDEWYPFVIPAKLDPDSPANIGKLVLDPPAGKHGFVKVKDGHFYFEDGTRARFWGTNLCFSACFPEKKHAEMIADRIAFFGFNAVRLHHMDFYFEPRGIFKDVDPAFKDPQKKRTGFLSEKQLSRLDYLIYLLKQRGIYIDMNLLVSRHFTEADGVKDAEALGMAAKPVSMFDPRLIELQKKYAKDLLTHYNPYTKLRYCDDPAIALVEITNENSIIASWKNNQLNGKLFGLKKSAIPDHYSIQLDKLWNDWLKTKYKTTDNVKKAWQTSLQTAHSVPLNFDLTHWTTEQHQGASLNIETTSDTAALTINSITDTAWHLQFRTVAPLMKDKNYILSFTAKADREIPLGIVSQLTQAPYTNLGLSDTVAINTGFTPYEIPFTANETADQAKIGFIVGYSKGKIEIKDVSLKETGPIGITSQEEKEDFRFQRPLYKLRTFYPHNRLKDIEHFYVELQKGYFNRMTDFLKQELKLKCPITGIGGYSQSEDILTQESCDFLDKHAYWDHPRFPNKQWDANDFTIHNRSLIQDKNLGIIGQLINARTEAAKQSPAKPFTVTEWNHCYPNQYAYETPPLLAAKAVEQDWDALFQFAFSHGWKTEPVLDDIHSYFDLIANSQQLILCSLGSFIFFKTEQPRIFIEKTTFQIDTLQMKGFSSTQKEKNCDLAFITLPPSSNGSFFLYSIDNKPIAESNSLILIAVGNTKNTGSRWNNGKFDWGTTPILIGKTLAKTEIVSNKNLTVYELTADGKQKGKIDNLFKNNKFFFQPRDSNTSWFEVTVEQSILKH